MEKRNCPNCSAQLRYDPASGFYQCDYCGGRFAGNSEIERAIFDSTHAEEKHRREMELEEARHAHAAEETKQQIALERQRAALEERNARTVRRWEIRDSRKPLRGCGGPVRITLSVVALVWVLFVVLLIGNTSWRLLPGLSTVLMLVLAGPAVIYLLVSVIMTFSRKR